MKKINIDHDKNSIHKALDLSLDHKDAIQEIVKGYFNEDRGGKISKNIIEVVQAAKKALFNADSEVTEYELTIAYIATIVTLEIEEIKQNGGGGGIEGLVAHLLRRSKSGGPEFGAIEIKSLEEKKIFLKMMTCYSKGKMEEVQKYMNKLRKLRS